MPATGLVHYVPEIEGQSPDPACGAREEAGWRSAPNPVNVTCEACKPLAEAGLAMFSREHA